MLWDSHGMPSTIFPHFPNRDFGNGVRVGCAWPFVYPAWPYGGRNERYLSNLPNFNVSLLLKQKPVLANQVNTSLSLSGFWLAWLYILEGGRGWYNWLTKHIRVCLSKLVSESSIFICISELSQVWAKCTLAEWKVWLLLPIFQKLLFQNAMSCYNALLSQWVCRVCF